MANYSEDLESRLAILKRTPIAPLPLEPLRALINKPCVYLTGVPSVRPEIPEDVDTERLCALASDIFARAPVIDFNADATDIVDDFEMLQHLDLPLAGALRQYQGKVVHRSTGEETNKAPRAKIPGKTSNNKLGENVEIDFQAHSHDHDLASKLMKHVAGKYRQLCQEFLLEPTAERLIKLTGMLTQVDAHDVDVEQALAVIQESSRFMDCENALALICCQVLLKYRLKCPDSLALNVTDNTAAAVGAFRRVSFDMNGSTNLLVELEQTLTLFTSLAEQGTLEDPCIISLLTAADHILLRPLTSTVMPGLKRNSKKPDLESEYYEKLRRATAKFLKTCYCSLPHLREDILLDLLASLQKNPNAYCRNFIVSAGKCSKKVSMLAVLLLEMVQISGLVSKSVWKEAAAYKTKNGVDQECKRAMQTSLHTANIISTHITDWSKDGAKSDPLRKLARTLTEDIAELLLCVEYPGAELFITCLVANVFRSAKNSEQISVFPSSVFELLKALQGPLHTVYIHKRRNENVDPGPVVDYLENTGQTQTALFLASRVYLNKSMDYQEIYLYLDTGSGRRKQNMTLVAQSRWPYVLSSWPIGLLYEKIMGVMLAITQEGTASDKVQVEVLRLLTGCVGANPKFFDRIRANLIERLGVSTASVCDGIAQVIISYVSATNLNDHVDILKQLSIRIGTPGALSYKKRCINLFAEIYGETSVQELRNLTWKNLLMLSVDRDRSVADLAIQVLDKLVFKVSFEGGVSKLCELSETVLAMYTSAQPLPGILMMALKKLFSSSPDAGRRQNIHRFMAHLLRSTDVEELGPPRKTSMCFDEISAAAAVIEANGLYMPVSKLATIFALACSDKRDILVRLMALKMLNAALQVRPRMIISPKVASQMFVKLLGMLQVYQEMELEYAAKILYELAHTGSASDKSKRQRSLRLLLDKVFGFYEQLSNGNQDLTRDSSLRLRQLILILASGIRFWNLEASPVHRDTKKTLKVFMELAVRSTKHADLRLALIRSVTRICTTYPQLFVDPQCDKFFSSQVTKDVNSRAWNDFMAILLSFLQAEEDEERLWELCALAANGRQEGLNHESLHGTGDGIVAESTSAGIVQKFLPALLERALLAEDNLAITATRLLVQAVEANRVDINASIPTIIALTTARAPEIAQTAQSCFEGLCRSLGVAVAVKLPEGLKLALVKKNIGPNQDCIARLWDLMKLGSFNRMPVVQRIAKSLRDGDVKYAALIARGFSFARLEHSEAKALNKGLEAVCYSCDYQQGQHGAPHLTAMILYFALRMVLCQKYGLWDDEGSMEEQYSVVDSESILAKFVHDLPTAAAVFDELLELPDGCSEQLLSHLLYSRKRHAD